MIGFSKHHSIIGAAALACAATLSPTAAWADATPECNAGPLPGSTECGANSDASLGTQNTAVGADSSALGGNSNTAVGAGSQVPVGFQNTAIGAGSTAGDPANNFAENNTALGQGSTAGNGNANTAIGQGSTAVGNSNSAFGQGASAGGLDDHYGGYNTGNTAIGAGAQAGAASLEDGAPYPSYQNNNTAIGYQASVLSSNSVALGANSVVTLSQPDSVSIGSAGNERRIVNVAAGFDPTDAANVAQVVGYYEENRTRALAAQATADTARTEAAAAQTTADTARVEAAAAQDTADTAIVRGNTLGASTAAALGGGSAYDDATGAVSAPTYTIGSETYHDVGSAFAGVDRSLTALDGRIDALADVTDTRFSQANGGIAAAMALAGTMIVPDSTVSVSFNLATYRGEQGFSGAVTVRAAPKVYFSGGFAGSTVKGSTGARAGVAFGF